MTTTVFRKETDPTITMAGLSLRLSAELKDDIDDLAFSAGTDTSALLLQLIQNLVDANRTRIDNFRKLADEPIVWGFTSEDKAATENK